MRSILLGVLVVALDSPQTPTVTGAQFAFVSIKPHTNGIASAMRMLPDGSQTMTNIHISQIISSASPLPVVEVDG